MSNACPLNFVQVDSSVARFSALLVALLVIIYLATSNIYILLYLVYDFSMKLFVTPKASLIMILAKLLKNSFRVQEKLVDGGAKRLAAFLGFFFVILLIIAHFLASPFVIFFLAAIFLLCSLLDVFFDYCIGCQIYFIIKKIYPDFMNNL